MNPIRIIIGWVKTLLEILSLKPYPFEYECPKCHNGNVEAEMYGTYDQFESGTCTTCKYNYDGLTEDYI